MQRINGHGGSQDPSNASKASRLASFFLTNSDSNREICEEIGQAHERGWGLFQAVHRPQVERAATEAQLAIKTSSKLFHDILVECDVLSWLN